MRSGMLKPRPLWRALGLERRNRAESVGVERVEGGKLCEPPMDPKAINLLILSMNLQKLYAAEKIELGILPSQERRKYLT